MPFEMLDTHYSPDGEVALDFDSFVSAQVIPKMKEFTMDDAYSDEHVYCFITSMVPRLFNFYPKKPSVLILFNRIELADRLTKWDWECFDNRVEMLVSHELDKVAFKVNRQ
jgi:hypothetical protein